MIRFTFEGVKVEWRGAILKIGGSGSAECSVDGYAKFYPGVMTFLNGDPGYPDEWDVDIKDVTIDGEVDIEDIDSWVVVKGELSKEDEELLENNDEDAWEEIIELIEQNITDDNCEFDEDDCVEQLAEEQQEINY